jgi:uncharacterized membrane protein
VPRVEETTSMRESSKGTIIALSVAALFGSGAAFAAEPAADAPKGDAKVRCSGINECAGKGGCAGAGNACAGKNACKGKGVVETTAEECAKKNGTVVK